MWKRLVALIVIILLLLATPVLADSSVGITITASGIVCSPPTGFTIIYISDYEIGLSWTKGVDAVNTMIRVKDGSVPTSRTDGNLVYSGNGTYATDTGVNFQESTGSRYYRAWSQTSGGIWEDIGASNFLENPNMTLIAFFVFCGIMSFIATRSSYWILKYLAGFAWWFLDIYWLSNPPSVITKGSPADVVMVVLLIIIGLSFMIMPFWFSRNSQGNELPTSFKARISRLIGREEEEETHASTRQERNAEYRERVHKALQGRIERRHRGD